MSVDTKSVMALIHTEYNFTRLLLDKTRLCDFTFFLSLQKLNQASYPHLIFSYFGCERFNENKVSVDTKKLWPLIKKENNFLRRLLDTPCLCDFTHVFNP